MVRGKPNPNANAYLPCPECGRTNHSIIQKKIFESTAHFECQAKSDSVKCKHNLISRFGDINYPYKRVFTSQNKAVINYLTRCSYHLLYLELKYVHTDEHVTRNSGNNFQIPEIAFGNFYFLQKNKIHFSLAYKNNNKIINLKLIYTRLNNKVVYSLPVVCFCFFYLDPLQNDSIMTSRCMQYVFC